MMSACPACCDVSAMMCKKTRRADHLAPGSNQGADGSGWLASRSGSDETNSSVSRATASYPMSNDLTVSPSSMREPFSQLDTACSSSGAPIADGPSMMKRLHCRSVTVTCLMRPASVKSLTVVR